MKRIALILLLAACASRPPAAPRPAVNAATTATIKRIETLLTDQPRNAVYTYLLATYYDQAYDVENVVRVLTRLEELDWQLGLGPDSFPNTSTAPAFQRIASRLAARETAVHRATTAFRLAGTVKSEGITYDSVEGMFYLSGGKTKLLRVDRTGKVTDIPVEPLGEKTGRLGTDVDATRRQLWVVGASFDPAAPASEKGRSNISVYDLRDGRLVRQVSNGSEKEPSFLNDMTLLADGTAFVTDTGRNQVFRLAPGADAFELWAEDFRGPNGIAVSADERTLYVADFRGINTFDLATKSRRLLETSTPLNGIDGLVEHRGTLIGIQNVLGRPRVVRVHISDGNRVEVLESKNPLLNVPATGVVAGDHYYFIANLSEKNAERVVLAIPL
jgi:sugar lactone lactonase YvrE